MRRLLVPLLLCLVLTGCGKQEVVSETVPKDLGYCLALIQDMERRYGIEILIGEEAAARQPWDYAFTPSSQAGSIYRQLTELDRCLSRFPNDLLEALFSPSVTVCLVNQITGVPGAGSVKSADGLQFSGDDGLTLALAQGPNMARGLYHELYHLMEPNLSVENWDALNPAGFTYPNSLAPQDPTLAQGENRAFLDAYSMSYAKEDRARIFEYAMTEGNEDLFLSEILQKKLAALSAAIREAYGLEGDLPWEQYLP